MHRLTLEKVKLFRKNFFIPQALSDLKNKFKQKTHKQHTFLFRVLCTAVFSFLKHPVKGDDREEIFYTFASENNKITIIKKCTMCSFFLPFFGRSLRRQMEIRVVKNLSSSMCVCAMEIQSWQASRQLCKRGAFHSALLVKVAACNTYQVGTMYNVV